MNLPTKIQYKNFEPGEFTDKKERNYDQTIGIIENFPWMAQRDHLQVGPTGPSITMEGNNDDFLKLALYYEGGFILYYLNTGKQLFTKSLNNYSEAYPYISAFFASSPFDTSDFRLEQHWLQGKSVHFIDKDFHYTMNKIRFLVFTAFSCTFLLVFLSMVAAFMIAVPGSLVRTIVLVFFMIPLTGMGLTLGLLFNHYRYSRNKLLIISKGADTFYYGDSDDPKKFYKKDILRLIVYESLGGRRSQVSCFTKLEFRTDDPIYISNMLLYEDVLVGKFPGNAVQYKYRLFPFIRPLKSPSSSIPS